MNDSCILVGNGTSLLDAPRGSEIDSHGCVVRFNAFTIGEHKPHTGVHCDEWFTVMQATPTCPRTQMPWRHIHVHSWEPDPRKCETFASHQRFREHNLTKVDHRILMEISQYVNTDFKAWSTGLLAIWIMLKRHPLVTITGFDWWDRQEHHYNDKAQRGTLHKPALERECVNNLKDQGRIHFL